MKNKSAEKIKTYSPTGFREKFLGEDNEWLILYAKRKLETKHYNYFVFGHRHLPMIIPVGENSQYANLGDWIGYFTYGVFDGEKFELKEY